MIKIVSWIKTAILFVFLLIPLAVGMMALYCAVVFLQWLLPLSEKEKWDMDRGRWM